MTIDEALAEVDDAAKVMGEIVRYGKFADDLQREYFSLKAFCMRTAAATLRRELQPFGATSGNAQAWAKGVLVTTLNECPRPAGYLPDLTEIEGKLLILAQWIHSPEFFDNPSVRRDIRALIDAAVSKRLEPIQPKGVLAAKRPMEIDEPDDFDDEPCEECDR